MKYCDIVHNDVVIDETCTPTQIDMEKSGISDLVNKVNELISPLVNESRWRRHIKGLREDFLLFRDISSSLMRYIQGKRGDEIFKDCIFPVYLAEQADKEENKPIPQDIADKITGYYLEICKIYYSLTGKKDLELKLELS